MNEDLKKKWIEAISKHQSLSSCHFMICELHFIEEDYTRKREKANGKQILKNDAIPSVFPTLELDHMQSAPKSNRIYRRYCHVKYCRNEFGTLDKNVLFFR